MQAVDTRAHALVQHHPRHRISQTRVKPQAIKFLSFRRSSASHPNMVKPLKTASPPFLNPSDFPRFKKLPMMDRTSLLDGHIRRKRRRNSSPKKDTTNTIWFPIDSNKKILPALTEADDREVAFSDRVLRLSPAMKLVQYQLIVGQKQVYLFKDKSGNKKDSFPLREIEKVSMSHQSDNFLILKLRNPKSETQPTKAAVVLVARRKIQLLQILNQQAGGDARGLAVSVADRITFLHTDGKKYILVSTRTDFGVQSSFYLDSGDKGAKVKKDLK
jgi:hypothetical protein